MANFNIKETDYYSTDTTYEYSEIGEEEKSAQILKNVEAHLEKLRTKCEKIDICVDELLKDENILNITNGYDLSLKKACSLVYKSGSQSLSNFTNQCGPKDREDIQTYFELHLQLVTASDLLVWRNVTRCLEKNYGIVETPTCVDQICGLAYNRAQLCDATTHGTIRGFFNDKIQDLRCTNKVAEQMRMKKTEAFEEIKLANRGDVIGSVAVGILLLLVLFTIGFICCRLDKSRKRQKCTINVTDIPALNADNYPVYLETLDEEGYTYSSSLNLLSQPARDTTPADGAELTVREDVHDYLEPIEYTIPADRAEFTIRENAHLYLELIEHTKPAVNTTKGTRFTVRENAYDYLESDGYTIPGVNTVKDEDHVYLKYVGYTQPGVNTAEETQFIPREDAHGYLEPMAAGYKFRPTPRLGISQAGYK